MSECKSLRVDDFFVAGCADQTVMIQQAVNALMAGSIKSLEFNDETYQISAPIVMSANVITGLRLSGNSRLGTIITQMSNNVPIFHITGQTVHSLRWERMWLTYNTMQTGNTAACVFQFDGPSNGSIFNCVFEDIQASNFYWFANAPVTHWWGNTYRDCAFGDFAGGINNITSVAGEPNNRFERLYINCPSAIGPLFNHNAVSAQFDNIEVNQASSGAPMLYDGGGGNYVIGHWALEVATYNASAALFNVPNGTMHAEFIYTNTLSIGTGATVTAFVTGGTDSYFEVRMYENAGFAVNNGMFLLANLPGPLRSRFGQPFAPFSNNCLLSDVAGSVTPDYLVVDAWGDKSRMQMNGDASVTIGYSDAYHQVFDVPLTAARTATLPEHRANTSNVLFSGRGYRFVKPNTSAFALSVNDITGALVASIPASNRGVIEIAWNREAHGGAGWVLLDNRTY